jgi:hypothetical protein
MPAWRPVTVEVYLLRSGPGGALAYRRACGHLGAGETPDEAAARIGQIAPGGPVQVAVHSTSWRHLADGSIVLAYAAAPDPDPRAPALPITTFDLVHGPSADRPSPPSVDDEHVAAHAARHLALLIDTSPLVRLALSADPALYRALSALPHALAGQLNPA